MSKITIHRALTELKTISDRIDSSIYDLEVAGTYSSAKKLIKGYKPLVEFEKDVKADYQSVLALMTRRIALKSAINKANTMTNITIGDFEMTILEAINYKNAIVSKKELLRKLKSQRDAKLSEMNRHNELVSQKADNLAEIALGKDGVRSKSEDVEAIRKPYIESNELTLSDPLGLDKTIKDLELEINNFDAEVDATLSEINATTFVEVA